MSEPAKRLERLFELRRRHKAEVLKLVLDAIAEAGSISGASKMIGMDRSAIHRELREAGKSMRPIQ